MRGDTPVSPWVWQAGDYLGRTITITLVYDNVTRATVSASIVRQPGCLWGHLLIGVGANGSPDTTTKSFAVPVGTTTRNASQLASVGLGTIENVWALQITAGP